MAGCVIKDVYDDALFHTSDVPQLLSGIKEFKKDIQVDKLTTKCELDIAKKRCLCTDCANDKCERIGEECVIKIDAIDAEALAIKSELYSFGSKKFSSASAFDNELSPNYVKVEDTAATLTKDLNVDEKITLSSSTFKLTLKKIIMQLRNALNF